MGETVREIFCSPIAVAYVSEKEQYIFGPDAVGFGVLEDSVIVGGVVLSECNGSNVFIHIAADSPALLSKRLARAVFHFAFNVLNVKRVTSFVNDDLPQAERLNKLVGFQYEHTMVDFHENGGTKVYRMLRNECRWVSPRNLNS